MEDQKSPTNDPVSNTVEASGGESIPEGQVEAQSQTHVDAGSHVATRPEAQSVPKPENEPCPVSVATQQDLQLQLNLRLDQLYKHELLLKAQRLRKWPVATKSRGGDTNESTSSSNPSTQVSVAKQVEGTLASSSSPPSQEREHQKMPAHADNVSSEAKLGHSGGSISSRSANDNWSKITKTKPFLDGVAK
jgi:hypothetical protein